MASSGDERRMVFDIRGRRKNVVKVVYAILALLMGLSLLLVVGPFNLGEIVNSGSSNGASDAFVEQAERAEQKVKKDPQNPDLLANLTKSRINAGNAMVEFDSETGAAALTPEGRAQLELGSEAWDKYLAATDEPSAGLAQSVARTLFTLAETARNNNEIKTNIRAARDAQQIVAQQRPSIGTLSTLATYQLYAFDYPGAKQSQKKAEAFANTKFERENLGNELEATEKRAREFEKVSSEIKKAEKKAESEGKTIPNPLTEGAPSVGG